MARCPKGHESVATDYCDECGTPMSGQPSAVPVSAPPASAPEAPAASGEVCPSCGSPRDGRFCEVCGHDFVLGGGEEKPSTPEPATPVVVDGGGELPRRAGTPGGWRAVAVADPEYHARMQAMAMPDAPPIEFPSYCPERRFPMGRTQLLIGRRRPSRGIEPDIDLTGPPEDPAVSHSHALLVSDGNGGWTVVDLASANGTYLNEATDPIEPHVPVPVKSGDRIHVGAFTTLTLEREAA
jgi:FHA domain